MVRFLSCSPILAAFLILSIWTATNDAVSHVGNGRSSRCYEEATTIHKFSPSNIDGNVTKLADFEGKVLLVVNVASFCTFTPQYHALTALKNTKGFEGKFEILAFPCNQFGYQEPGENKYEIMNSLRWVRPGYGYTPNFEMFEKINVNGEDEIGLYTHLKASCPPAKLDIGDKTNLFWTPLRNNDITWNFNKFLIGADGVPYKRYDSAVEPEDLSEDIRELIKIKKEKASRAVENEAEEEHKEGEDKK